MTQKSLKLMSGQPDSVRTSPLARMGPRSGLRGSQSLDCFTSLCVSFEDAIQEPLSSKTSTAFSL